MYMHENKQYKHIVFACGYNLQKGTKGSYTKIQKTVKRRAAIGECIRYLDHNQNNQILKRFGSTLEIWAAFFFLFSIDDMMK